MNYSKPNNSDHEDKPDDWLYFQPYYSVVPLDLF